MPEIHQLQTSGGVRLCEIFGSVEELERDKIASKLYGGGYLMQTVGTPARILTLSLRAWSDAERDAVNEAEAYCTPVAAKLADALIDGTLLDAPSWSAIVPGIYEATVKMVVSA